MNAKYLYILMIGLLGISLSACHHKSNDGAANGDSLNVDTMAQIESDIDTNEIKLSRNFAEVFGQLKTHRWINFPWMKGRLPEEWEVDNELYGAKLLTEAYDKSEILDSLISWRIDSYKKENEIESGLMEYADMEKFLSRFRPKDDRDLALDEEQVSTEIDAEIEQYSASYYQTLLGQLPENKRLQAYAIKEYQTWKIFKRSQHRLLNALRDGHAPANEHANLEKALNIMKRQADVTLYFEMIHKGKNEGSYEQLKDQFFFDVYNGFIKDLKATQEMGFGKKITALMEEQKCWLSYIFARRQLSGKLTDAQEKVYDNCTNRLQKLHIIQLKNRMEGYGYCSDAYRSSLLNDSCSYPELYKYESMKIGTKF